MEKLNYELVGKKATLECLMSGEIESEEMFNFYVIDLSSKGSPTIQLLPDKYTLDTLSALNNPDVLFVQKSE